MKLYNGDCLEIMKTFESEIIDLTITSPPYDNLRDYNGFSFDFENIAKELFRITKKGGTVVWIAADATINGSETLTSFKQALFFKKIGFNVHDTMIYKKTGISFPDKNRYYSCFEYMFILTKGKIKTFNPIADRKNKNAGQKITGRKRQKDGSLTKTSGEKKGNCVKEYSYRFNIWEYDTGWMKSYKESYIKEHPAVFPYKLAQDHILSWSNEGDLIFDPFAGSGTTLKMAKENNRNFIGIELDKKYFEIAKKRIANTEKGLF